MSGWRLGAVAIPRTPEGDWLAIPVGEEDRGKEEKVWGSGLGFESFEGMLAFLGGGVRASDVNPALGVCISGLSREIREESGLEGGQLTELPGTFAVEQRGARLCKFVVATFILDVNGSQLGKLLDMGAVEVRDPDGLRPRDRWIFNSLALSVMRQFVEAYE
jgi:ADP-ribose pyrophosphatase YjhB (NUDIX family)